MVTRLQRLPERIYSDILGRIVEGEFKEGEKLPTEQDLAQRFQASRPTVREALARLRADGIIVTRHGSGTTVARRPDPDLRRFAPLETLSDIRRCYDFRIVLEAGAASFAALNADEPALAKIQHAYDRLQEIVTSRVIGVKEDFLFHLAIADASQNHYLASALSFMEQQVVASIDLARNLSATKSTERQREVQAEHLAIVTAIRERDADAAAAAMRRHLENARARMFGN